MARDLVFAPTSIVEYALLVDPVSTHRQGFSRRADIKQQRTAMTMT